jgi:hypothetical protein
MGYAEFMQCLHDIQNNQFSIDREIGYTVQMTLVYFGFLRHPFVLLNIYYSWFLCREWLRLQIVHQHEVKQ